MNNKPEEKFIIKDGVKYYSINCPHCSAELITAKSLFHQMGLFNKGYGSCLECDKPMRITYNPDNDTMTATVWEVDNGKQA